MYYGFQRNIELKEPNNDAACRNALSIIQNVVSGKNINGVNKKNEIVFMIDDHEDYWVKVCLDSSRNTNYNKNIFISIIARSIEIMIELEHHFNSKANFYPCTACKKTFDHYIQLYCPHCKYYNNYRKGDWEEPRFHFKEILFHCGNLDEGKQHIMEVASYVRLMS